MSGRGVTRRELARALLVCGAAGLLPACSAPTTGAAQDELPEFEPGKPLPWINWGGNQGCRPAWRSAPESETAVLDALRTPGSGTIRPVGAGHSFSALVPSDGTLLATDLLSGVISSDATRLEAEVWAGTRLHALGPLLEARGQALPNLPDIDYQTLGGAVATSTHGTGPRFGSLSSYVSGLTLATLSGELLECSTEQNPEIFAAARCSLGALGVVTRLRLRNQEPFRLREAVRFEPLEDVLAEIETRRDASRHFEFHALPHSSLAMVATTDEAGPGEDLAPAEDHQAVYLLRDVFALTGRIPLAGDFLYDLALRAASGSAESLRVGASHRILTHVRLARFREMEYTLPAEAGPACLREILRTIRERRIPVVFPIEYRYARSDDVWLSMFHERDGCSISVHQYADEDWRPYFAEIEPIFRRHEGRPHWGKLHTLEAAQLASLYPRWREFQEVRRALDPDGRLLNPHLRRVFGA